MGVPRFFQFVKQTFPDTVHKTNIKEPFITNVDNFYIDANGILHNCVREVFFSSHNKDTHHKRLAFNKTKPPTSTKPTLKKVYTTISDYITQIVEYVHPSSVLFIAIDGPAPLAKQSQQRQRRFRSAQETDENIFKLFDKNAITPGTSFMADLSSYLETFIINKMNTNNYWKSLNIVFSNSNVPGEGEHKIIQYIRNLSNKNLVTHCMYGLDADLFMLSLSTHCPKFYLLREDIFHVCDYTTYFHVANIGLLQQQLFERWDSKTDHTTQTRLVNDFIFISFLVGNDFLHATPMCHNLVWAIPFMMDIRQQALNNDYITTPNGHGFYLKKLLLFCSKLQHYESNAIADLARNNTFQYPAVNSSLIDTHNITKGIHIDIFKKHYYKKAHCHNQTDIMNLTKEYIQGLEWVNAYYHSTSKNWLWMYPSHYTPLISDIVTFLKSGTKITKLSNKQYDPIDPFEQLLCVLPPKSKHLIPKTLHVILEQLSDYYPEEFQVDIEGKTREWQGIALLPFLPYERLHELYIQKKKLKTIKHNKLNTLASTLSYSYIDNTVSSANISL